MLTNNHNWQLKAFNVQPIYFIFLNTFQLTDKLKLSKQEVPLADIDIDFNETVTK